VTPRITAIRRRRRGVPFLEERFRGRQYRCAVCNRVFLDEPSLTHHLALEGAARPDHADLPPPGGAIDVRLPYLADLKQILGERKRLKRDRR
jgi:hypothetical protein